MESAFDVVVVGGGMAGAAAAAEVSRTRRVALLEMEAHPGHHSTGRSAAVFTEHYGNAAVRALSRASRPFIAEAPLDFTAVPLFKPRPILWVARHDQAKALDELAAFEGGATRRLSADEVTAILPLAPSGHIEAGLLEPNAGDIEVHELQQGYLRRLRRNGGVVMTHCRLLGLLRQPSAWRVQTSQGTLEATVIVNAAGAWADEIAAMAEAQPIGLTPYRRTAVLIDPPAGADTRAWPMVVDTDEQFYFKPDAGLILVCPSDETPCPPGDVQADELDVAIAVDRYERSMGQAVRRVRKAWAGLRSFVVDRSPVVGFAPETPGFYWFAALGGYGIQTAPALARLVATQVTGEPPPADLLAQGVDPVDLAPTRIPAAARETRAT